MTPEKIENALESSELVDQAIVCGDSTQDFVVAIVVVKEHTTLGFKNENQIENALLLEMKTIAPHYQ